MRIEPGSLLTVRQQVPHGLGHAIWCARAFIGDEPFAILLPDDLILSETPCLKQLADAYEQTGGNIVAVVEVPREHTNRYGILRTGADDGRLVEVGPNTWEIFRFFLNDGRLDSEAVGMFTQFPLRLAFALTIHKSQGKTFERVILDVGRGTFAPGQLYVALSRCTSLEGIVLRKALRRQHILLDWAVVRYLTRSQYDQASKALSREEKLRILETAIGRKDSLEMVYLKGSDVKSRRTVKPLHLGEMEYAGRPFLGLEAWCLSRRGKRVFNIDRILSLQPVGERIPDLKEKR
jgi:hypothetical protein